MSLEERLLEAAERLWKRGYSADDGPIAPLLREAAEANRELVEGLRNIEALSLSREEFVLQGPRALIMRLEAAVSQARALIAKMEGR